MKLSIAIAFMILTTWCHGQSQESKDSLVTEICKSIMNSKSPSDSVRIFTALQEHFYPFLGKYPEGQREDIATNVFFRLQRNCKAFKAILDKGGAQRGDWETVATKPATMLTKKECAHFPDHKEYKYLESTGDTVRLELANGFWVDHFKDGTFSKLKLRWIADCEFEIEFVESNNNVRKNFSKPGDKYRYQVIDKTEGYYKMSVEIPDSDQHLLFKIYYR